MLRILIVDDEMPIREGLAKIIGKESPNFLVVGTCTNGQEVLDLLPRVQVDVVLTDIRMPRIDGLELIGRLKELRPQTRCILMSGFADFEYAREAIRHGAVDYLLKPVNKAQLFGLLRQLSEQQHEDEMRARRFRTDLLHSCLTAEKAEAPCPASLQLPHSRYAVFTVKGGCERALGEYAELMRPNAELGLDIVPIRDRLQAWIWYLPPAQPLEYVLELARDQLTNVSAPIHLGASQVYTRAQEIHPAYLEAKQACQTGIYARTPCHFAKAGGQPKAYDEGGEGFSHRRHALSEALQILNIPAAVKQVEQIFTEMRAKRAATESILCCIRSIHEIASTELQEWDTPERRLQRSHLEEELTLAFSFEELERRFITSFTAALSDIRELRQDQAGRQVETVKQWIAKHYGEQHDLGTLAKMVYLTPNYLSKLFKQESGCTITDYIIEVRIKKAKQLLRHSLDMKVNEIGREVGYPDPAYFNKLFKRVVGVTPNEYKRLAQVR